MIVWANESFAIARKPEVGYCVIIGDTCGYAADNREFDEGEPQRVVVGRRRLSRQACSDRAGPDRDGRGPPRRRGGGRGDGAYRASGGRALAIGCDVNDSAAVAGAVAETVRAFGGLHVVSSNAAAITAPKPLAEMDEAEWRRAMDVNVTGSFSSANMRFRR